MRSQTFDMIAAFLGAWLLGGIVADGWAHNHIKVDSFFTPWHAALYTGYLANAAFHFWSVAKRHREGRSWADSVRPGYGTALLGVIVFGFSGIGDLIWHTIFGIEVSVSAGFSPPHLGIMIGIGTIVSSPFVAAWKRRRTPQGWYEWAPIILSLALCVSLMTFVTQYIDPLVEVEASRRPLKFHDQAIGAMGAQLHMVILTCWILMAVERWSLPNGSLTVVFAFNVATMSLMRDSFFLIPAIVLAGVAADLLLFALAPSPRRRLHFRAFAFAMPVVYYLLYFAAVWIRQGISWPIPLWTGTAVMAGVVSVLLSFLVVKAERE